MSIVTSLDHFARGIVKEDGKVIFVSNALENEDIEYKLVKETKKYSVASLVKINNASDKRVEAKCPYFNICGGCSLQHLKYEDTLNFKKQKIEDIINRYAGISIDVKVIKNDSPYNYRNKISLKVVDSKVGFYQNDTHILVEIKECIIAKSAINDLLKDISYFNILNGLITIRCNYNDELLIVINSKDEINIDIDYLSSKHKIVGIVLNDKLYYGEDKFIDIINKKLFQVSYNSFFQVNPFITSKLFDLVEEIIEEDSIVADLFCGVGTLGIVASKSASKVYGIEVVENAIKNALVNKKMNKISNINFMLGDANKLVSKINDNIDTFIVDPPRSGLSKEGTKAILDILPSQIIYISCDPMTLARDLNILKKYYDIKQFYMIDMFSYTYHVESVLVLVKKDYKNKI